ncbi:Periodic tryptophan protein 1 [Araneus ventricosus]|uniref:Periodic tryptophan protein 1 n=1 Tax=Araneus ventricosus TaxID=182803 RepID=A0A4Y2B7I5_ARAVE|nr:Periodic tryptophan protein 1 [Araneus ventricosus]
MSEDPQDQLTFPEEFLNSLTPTGLPPYELKVEYSQTEDYSEEDEEEPLSDAEKDEVASENEPASKTNDKNSNTEEDFESRYNLDAYDDEDDDRPFMNIGDVAVYVDNKEDNYLEEPEGEVDEDEKEEQEDFLIKANDNLLVVGHVEEDSSVLEVYVYNKDDDALYVHHDIVLPAYPLALEWLDFHPSDETPGNYVAVGDMSPVIKVYDLDVVDILEPDYCLGEEPKKKKKQSKVKMDCHEDAVISLSWNKHTRNILASGSADSSIIVWDLQEGVPLNKLNIHTGKVQSLLWHPFESPFLLSGCTNGLINVYDCRDPDSECKSWSVEGEIERVLWNLFDSLKFFCSTDTGFVHSIDMRNAEIERSLKVHNEGVTGLDMSQERNNILLTGSMDKTVKIWNIENGFTLLKSQKLKVGSVYTARFSPDSGLTVAIGGNDPSHSLKILDVAEMLNGDSSNSKKPKSSEATNGPPVNSSNTPPKKKIKIANKYGNSDDASHSRTFAQNEESTEDVKMEE